MLSVLKGEQFHKGTNHLKQEEKKERDGTAASDPQFARGGITECKYWKIRKQTNFTTRTHCSLHENSVLCLTFVWWHRGLYRCAQAHASRETRCAVSTVAVWER